MPEWALQVGVIASPILATILGIMMMRYNERTTAARAVREKADAERYAAREKTDVERHAENTARLVENSAHLTKIGEKVEHIDDCLDDAKRQVKTLHDRSISHADLELGLNRMRDQITAEMKALDARVFRLENRALEVPPR